MKFAIVIPVFNHAATIAQVIANLRSTLAAAHESLPLILINDGSTDATAKILATIPDIILLTHPRNRGKGAALKTAFLHAKTDFTHVITLDADGQHHPSDLLAILTAARAHPGELIIGCRDMDSPNVKVPAASKKGRDLARFWLRIQTGQTISDTQCGLRAYPLAPALAVPQRFHRYDFETEILARLAWGGLRIRSVPIRCIYFPKEERISHFRPILDTLRGVRVNIFLTIRRLLPLPFRRLTPSTPSNHPEFGSWWRWESWRTALQAAIHEGSSNTELSLAIALGVFVGLTPLFILQTILAIYFARRLHLNVIAAVIGSQISIPPLAPIWMGLSYAVGRLLLHGEWIFTDMKPADPSASAWTQHIWPFLLGNLIVCFTIATLSLIASRLLLYFFRANNGVPTAAPALNPAEEP